MVLLIVAIFFSLVTCSTMDLDAPAGKRNGNCQVADFEALFHDQLDAVVAHLQAELPDAGYDKANLAQLLVQLLQFMEDVSGKNGTHKGQPKIPMKLFRDSRADGPLFALAARIHQIKKLRDMKSIEFSNPQRRREHLEIYLNCRRELEKLNLIQQPKVFLDRSCLAQDQSKMKDIISRLGGQIAGAADEAGVTHHVFPFPSSGDPDDGGVYLRVQEFRGTKALVHWWYLPDSYDEYVARDLVPDQLEPDPEPAGPLKVYLRWVYDSERYNEWMNPTDYETKEAQEEQDRAAAGGRAGEHEHAHDGAHPAGASGAAGMPAASIHPHQGLAAGNPQHAQQLPSGFPRGLGPHPQPGHIACKRPPSPSRPDPHALLNSIKRLKAAEAHVPLPELAPGAGERLGLTVVKRLLQEAPRPVTEAALPSENLSLGQRVPMAGASRAHQLAELQAQQGSSLGPGPGPSSERAAARPQVAPRRVDSSWFNLDAINELERQGMPEFFSSRCPSQTPRTYKEARNLIVRKYREQPDRRLLFSEVKDELAGDVNAWYRLFEFLEERGIINPAAPGPSQQQGAPRPSGHQSAFRASLERAGPHRRFLYSPPQNAHEEGLQATLSGGTSFNLMTRKPMFSHKPVTDLASTADHYCTVMPWVKCNDVRYHCSKMPAVELCPKAFSEGRFPAGLSSRDFVRVDHRLPQLDENGWSAAENLLLLTGLELFGDNWSQVADHVGTKSQVQCILQFLQMPIDDLFISDMENGLRSPGAGRPRAPGPLPFTDTPNAVMAQVAFLATMVGPRVAAAAAMRALELLGELAPAGSGTDEVDLTQVPVPNEKVTEAASKGLAAAAAQARVQADQEERELQRLVAAAMQVQVQKIDVKLKYLDSLDRVLEMEHAALEAARAQQDSQLLMLKEQQQQQQQQGQGQQPGLGQGQHCAVGAQQLPATL